jgi:hypothetical protein
MSVFRMIRTQSVSLRPEVWLPLVVGLALGASIVVVPPWLVLLGLVGLVGAVIGVNRPTFFLLALIFLEATILPLDTPMLSVDVGLRVFLSDVLILLLFAVLVYRLLTQKDFEFVHTPLDLPLIVFLATVTVVTSIRLVQSSFELLPYVIPRMRTLLYLSIIFVITNLVRDKKQIHLLVNAILIFGAFVGLAMLAQAIVGESVRILPAGRVENLVTESVRYSDITRIIPPGRSTVFAATLLGCTVIILDGVSLKKAWRIGAAGLSGMGVVLTFFRSYWGAILFCFGLLFYFLRGRKRLAFVMGAVALVTLLIMVGTVFSENPHVERLVNASWYRFQTLLDVGDYRDIENIQWRAIETEHVLASIKKHPIIGVGLGARYRPFDTRLDAENYDGRRYTHNGHLWLISKTGVLSYLLFVWLAVVFVIRGLRHWRQIDDPLESAAVLSFSLALIGVFIAAIFEALFIEQHWMFIIAMMMGINEAIIRLNQNDASARA